MQQRWGHLKTKLKGKCRTEKSTSGTINLTLHNSIESLTGVATVTKELRGQGLVKRQLPTPPSLYPVTALHVDIIQVQLLLPKVYGSLLPDRKLSWIEGTAAWKQTCHRIHLMNTLKNTPLTMYHNVADTVKSTRIPKNPERHTSLHTSTGKHTM